jgi:predicted RNA-binding Zn-ribbon protein involved in translation (DUF1610 family)
MNQNNNPANMPDEVKNAIAAGFAQQAEKIVYPTERINLPSKGKLYAIDNPLSSGYIDLRYPTARDEDILTSKQLIQNGTVIDVFINNIISDKNIDTNSILIGDKNAIILAARILAYGKDYQVDVTCPKCGQSKQEKLDISQFQSKDLQYLDNNPNSNEFSLQLPATKATVKFKILTSGDETNIDAELKSLKKHKLDKRIDNEVTTRIRHAILSVENAEGKRIENIKSFVDNMPSLDAKTFRDKIRELSPNVDMNFNFECESCGHEGRMTMPLGIGFFWPSTEE